MLWTLQLSAWALPPLLAVLLLTRELLFLWPRRREPGSRALLLLVLTTGAWAALHLASVLSTSLDVKIALERVQYLVASAIPAAWLVFAMVFPGRRDHLKRAAAWLLFAMCAASMAVAAHPATFGLILSDVHLEYDPTGLAQMVVTFGPWYWAVLVVRFVAIVAATTALTGWLLRSELYRRRAPVAVAAAVLALAPAAAYTGWRDIGQWTDLSPTGLGLAAALLGWGLLRHRLLDLGPVARTLVMVELRDPIIVLDAKGRIVDANRAAESVLDLHPYGDVPVALGTLWASTRGQPHQTARVALEVVGEADEPDRRLFDVTVTPLGGRKGRGRTALLLRDVTAREEAVAELQRATTQLEAVNEELELLANTDGLTGLTNRRRFMEVTGREVERADRYQRPVSLLLLDLDHFKRVNDTHGHAAGDDVLRGTADALRSVCRDLDVAGRLGGEELAVVLPETDAAGAMTLAERLRRQIGDAEYEAPDGAPFQVTASIGVATVGPRARTAEALLQRADEALYEAKDQGRNRVVVSA